MPLKPIETKKVYMRVVEQIRNLVDNGELKPGDQLPTTQELADALQVSRPSVREALAALEILGLVESRPGSGSYITRRPAPEETAHQPAEVGAGWASAEEILEARLAYEPVCARLAAEVRSQDDLLEMQQTPELMMVDIERVADDLPARFKGRHGQAQLPPHDFSDSLHAVIARSTHNSLLVSFAALISRAVRSPTWQRMMRQIYLSPRNNSFFLKQFEALYDAIERRDADGAERVMREHLSSLSATLNE